MRSAAHFKGHPLHPSLIPFPFAFLWGAFVADVIGRVLNVESFWMTGWYLAAAGVISALLAAVPGFIDYFRTVPPESSGRARATKHMLLNLGTVLLFAIAFLLRLDAPHYPSSLDLVLEAIGAASLTMAGWLGGVLVSRNQIGVDHRYAEAGRWRDVSVRGTPGSFVPVARSDELKVDQLKLVRAYGRRIVLARTERGYTAFADGCTHKGGSLAGGVMICGVVQCPWHGSQFDAHTGAVKAGPAGKPIETFAVEERDGEIRLRL